MNLMSVDLYQSATDSEKFLALPAGTDPAELMGPMTFDQDYAQVNARQLADLIPVVGPPGQWPLPPRDHPTTVT